MKNPDAGELVDWSLGGKAGSGRCGGEKKGMFAGKLATRRENSNLELLSSKKITGIEAYQLEEAGGQMGGSREKAHDLQRFKTGDVEGIWGR